MRLTKKIKAFTLSEVVIAMIITVIVAGLAFSVLTLVQRHMYGIQSNFKNATDLNQLETALWLDFNRYPEVTYLENENKLSFKSPIDSLSYTFYDDYIMYKKDTLFVKFHDRLFFVHGLKVLSGEIDAIELHDSISNHSIFVFKQQSAKPFLK